MGHYVFQPGSSSADLFSLDSVTVFLQLAGQTCPLTKPILQVLTVVTIANLNYGPTTGGAKQHISRPPFIDIRTWL